MRLGSQVSILYFYQCKIIISSNKPTLLYRWTYRTISSSTGMICTVGMAEMISLLGPPPKELLARSDAMVLHKWPEVIVNEADKACWNAREFFGGPFSMKKVRRRSV